MFETLFSYFQSSDLAVWGLFALLVLCGLGLPLPEDIILVTAGALSAANESAWGSVACLMYAGVMLGDSTIFLAGKYWGGPILRGRLFRKVFSERKHDKVERLFARYGALVLFWGRFLPGLRMPIFFTAGSMRVPYAKLLMFDGLAALISVPAFVWFGRWLWLKFKDDFERLGAVLSRAHSYTMLGTLVVLAVVAVVLWLRHRHRREKAGAIPSA